MTYLVLVVRLGTLIGSWPGHSTGLDFEDEEFSYARLHLGVSSSFCLCVGALCLVSAEAREGVRSGTAVVDACGFAGS